MLAWIIGGLLSAKAVGFGSESLSSPQSLALAFIMSARSGLMKWTFFGRGSCSTRATSTRCNASTGGSSRIGSLRPWASHCLGIVLIWYHPGNSPLWGVAGAVLCQGSRSSSRLALGPLAGTAWAGSGGSGQPLPCKDLRHALGALSSRQWQLLVLLLRAITVLSSRFRSGCTTHSNGHRERQRSNLGPLSARWVEITSSRRARLAMTAPI